MDGDIFDHLIWVSGKRMIAQGADGLYREDLAKGVMAGQTVHPSVAADRQCSVEFRRLLRSPRFLKLSFEIEQVWTRMATSATTTPLTSGGLRIIWPLLSSWNTRNSRLS
jgi:hypothetical protein